MAENRNDKDKGARLASRAVGRSPLLEELKAVAAAHPKSKFVRSVVSEVLADGEVSPQELVRLRQAVQLEMALEGAKRGTPAPFPSPAKNELGVKDAQAEAFALVQGMLHRWSGSEAMLSLAAQVLEDGKVTPEEIAELEGLDASLEWDLEAEAKLGAFAASFKLRPKPSMETEPEPEAPAPKPTAESEPALAMALDPDLDLDLDLDMEAPKPAYRWTFPVPKFFPSGSRKKDSDRD